MREWPAIGVAVLLTPLVPGTALALLSGDITMSPLFIAGGYIISLPLIALVGLPVFLLLRQLRWLRWWTALLSGAPFGLFMALPFRSPSDRPWHSVGFALIGSVTALVFWLIWHTLTTEFTLDTDPRNNGA